MMIESFYRLALAVILCLAQVLILNQIWLFGVATPLLYVLFVITFHRNFPKWQILIWSFALGLVIDVFSNTPGLAVGILTLMALLQPYLLELFVPRDSVENLEVKAATLGWKNYTLLTVILTGLYSLLFFAIEAFNFFDWQQWLLRSIGSALLTIGMILTIETIRSK